MILNVPIAANWPKLHRDLTAVLGPVGYSLDALPGPVHVLSEAPLDSTLLARAQAICDAHDPASTASQREEEQERRIGAALDHRDRLLSAVALRTSSAWTGLTAEQKQNVQDLVDRATEQVRPLLI